MTRPTENALGALGFGERYRILRRLGEGGAGAVVLAEDTLTARRVAIKRLDPGGALSDGSGDALAAEFDRLRTLHHPNVAEVLDFGRDGDGSYLVEAFIDGVDLATAATDAPLAQRVRWLVETLRGLEAIHGRGLTHGDISSANVLVARDVSGALTDGHVRLIDLGLARPVRSAYGGISGTLTYLAPERLEPSATAAVEADLYAFGTLAYELLTGQRPFAAHEARLETLVRAHLAGQPRAPSTVRTDLSPAFDEPLLKLLERVPAHRPRTAREVIVSLVGAAGIDLAEETVETLRATVAQGPLVERDAALTAIRRLAAALAAGGVASPHIVMIQGPAGSGRSRLLAEAADQGRVAGLRVVTAQPTGAVLGPVRTWLAGLGQSADLLTGAGSDRYVAVERAAEALLAAVPAVVPEAMQGGLLLILDDADRCDELTRELLRVLADRIAESTAPDAPLGPLAVGMVLATATSLDDTLARHRGVLVEACTIGPLSNAGLASLLHGILGAELPPERVQAIARLTSGLPAHVIALLESWVDRGLVAASGSGLAIDPEALIAPLPESVAEALSSREARLSTTEHRVLAALRVMGESATAQLVASVCELEPAATQLALDQLVLRLLVGRDGVKGEARYRAERGTEDLLPTALRRQLHARLARALMDVPSRDGRESLAGPGLAAAARHAFTAVQLGETRLTMAGHRLALLAADEAHAAFATDVELRMLDIACALAPGPSEPSQEMGSKIGATLRRAALLRQLGRFDAAVEGYRGLAESATMPEVQCSAALGLAGVALDRGALQEAVERATPVVTSARTPAVRAEALALVARAQLLSGRYDDALAAVDAGLAAVAHGAAATVEAQLRATRALVFYYGDRQAEAITAFAEAREASERAGDRVGEATAVNGVGLVHHRRGEFPKALAAYEQSLALAEHSGDRRRVAIAAMNIGTVLHETGRLADAALRYRESLRASELIGDLASAARVTNNLGNLLVEQTRLREARYWIERSRRDAEHTGSRLIALYDQGLLGKVLHAEGDLDGARRELHGAVSELREMGNAGEAGELLIELGLISRTGQDPAGMDHFAASVVAVATSSGAEKQLAWAAYLRGEAHRMRGALDKALPELRQALAEAERHSLRELSWRAEHALGRMFREQGNTLEATARFRGTSERLLALANGLVGRERELYLGDRDRAAALSEAATTLSVNAPAAAMPPGTHERFMRVLEIVLQINRRLVAELDLQRLLDTLLDAAIELTGAERGFVILAPTGDEADKGGRAKAELEIQAARNIDRESLKKNTAKVSRSVARDVLESGEPIITLDAGEDARFKAALSVHAMKLRSILCFPLRAQGEVIGAIYLDNRFQASTFGKADLDVIAAFSDQAAAAVTNARLLDRAKKSQDALVESYARIESLNEELRARVSDQAQRLEEVQASLELQRSQLETRYRYDNIIGTSPALRRVFAVLDRVTDTAIPVLVQGESGTGKELIARAIHYNGPRRRDKPFVSVNCAALTETLLESELFGHMKGAFTGADRDRKGLFEVAHGGTLFLDEVADMSLAMQAKLLRALQEGEIWPVGARKAIRVDVRVVTACNRDLESMVKTKEFRQDLYFRLNVVRVVLPALRERKEDLLMLASHFLKVAAERQGGPVKRLSQASLDLLTSFAWPGNVRELEATLMNACLFCDGEVLLPPHFQHKPELFRDTPTLRATPLVPEAARPTTSATRAPDGDAVLDLTGLSLDQIEEKAIFLALERADGNKVEAARQLGITRQTLYNKLKAFGIEVRRDVRRLG